MRLWSLHPSHLDRIGLVACWRETLLAQAVLEEKTVGYRNHPQLERFRNSPDPIDAVGAYLYSLHDEATARGYNFNIDKVTADRNSEVKIDVTDGQLQFEWHHLGKKLAERSPDDAARWEESEPTPGPVFTVIPGEVESWERE